MIASADEEVIPYAEEMLGVMKVLMEQTGDSELVLRARATECVGVIAVILGVNITLPVHGLTLNAGKENFQKVAQSFMQLALNGMESDYPELREYTFGFFCNMAEVFQAEFVPMLETVIRVAFGLSVMPGDSIGHEERGKQRL